MRTIIFEATADVVRRYASEHLAEPQIRSVGRLTAVQSVSLEELDEPAIREIAEAYNLPLRSVRDQPPFGRPRRSRRHRPNARRRTSLALSPGDGSRH